MQKPCSNEHVEPVVRDDTNGETPTISTPTSELKDFHEPQLELSSESVAVEDPSKSESMS